MVSLEPKGAVPAQVSLSALSSVAFLNQPSKMLLSVVTELDSNGISGIWRDQYLFQCLKKKKIPLSRVSL